MKIFLNSPPHNYGKSRVDIVFFHKEIYCRNAHLQAGAIMTRSQHSHFPVQAGGMETKNVHTPMDLPQTMSKSLVGSNIAMLALMRNLGTY